MTEIKADCFAGSSYEHIMKTLCIRYQVPGFGFFSSPGTNVLGEVLSYPQRRCRRRRCCRRCRWRRQFQVKVFVF